jgi:cobalt-zinc-cadmium efflux system outer membrane protein
MHTSPSTGVFTPWVLVTVVSAGALVALSAGCATYERSQQDVDRAVEDWHRRRATLIEKPANDSPSQHVDDEMPADAPHRPVDIYIREALERNPGIQAAIADARAKLERIPQVTSLPDPLVRTLIRPEPIQTAAGDMYFTLGVAQTIPLLTKLERAGNVAAAETRIALERLNGKRVQVIADVERAYWQIYRLDRYVEITRDNRLLLEDLQRVIDTQYQVGRVQQQDLLRVQTELAKLRDDEHRYQIRRSSAVAALNQLTDHPPQREVPTTEPVDVPTVRADVESLVALAADHNPELTALREQVQRDREQIELVRLGYWPDVSVGVEWNYVDPRAPFIPPVNPQTGVRPPINRKSEAGDDNWALTVQMNIPIWSQRIEARKREARQRLLATQSELHSTENLIAFRTFDAWSRVEAQQETLRVLDTELIPQSRQTYEVTLTAYQAGETDFLVMIDNWRRWLDFELMRHRETVDLETAFADLQREVGLQLLRRDAAADEQMGDIDDES